MTATTAPKSVVHVLAGAGFGGAERVACTLALLARKHGYQSSVEAAPATRLGLTQFGLTTPATEDALNDWAKAARVRLRACRPTLVHVHLATPSLLGCALRVASEHPTLFTMHLLPEERWPCDRSYPVPSKWLLAVGTRLKRNLFVNTVSATDAKRLGWLVPKSKLRSVLNAPPLAEGDVSGGHDAWPTRGARLLAVGRLVEQKGYDRLLEALASAPLVSRDWHLVVVGDGPERQRLTQLATALGLQDRVTWLGAVAATPWLRRADLVLSTSRYEGMPLVPLEAIREGAPILVSDIAPHRELFQGTASHSLLPADERLWPTHVGMYVAHERSRRELADSQAKLYHLSDPMRQWREYAEIYQLLLRR